MSGEPKFARMPARAAGLGLTATDWAVLHVICLHADKAGSAYPSLARIATIARILRNHVSRSTKRLEELGLIRAQRLRRGEGWGNTQYHVLYDAPQMAPEMVLPEDDEVAPELVAPDRDRVAPEMVLGGTSGGARGGTSDGALTYQGTDQSTELTREEGFCLEDAEERGPEARPCSDVPLDPTRPCRAYVLPTARGYLCGKPSVAGTDHCPDHTYTSATNAQHDADAPPF